MDDWRGLPATAIRLGVPAVGWIVRAYVVAECAGIGCVAVLVLDVTIAAAHWWANVPLARSRGSTFGNKGSLTNIFLWPIALAVIFLYPDTLRMLRQWPVTHGG